MGTKNILLVLVGLGVYERSGIQYRACINISWIDRNICLDKFRKEVIGRMKQIHGGDVYRNKIKTYFSVNINPFGIPGAVEDALYTAVESCIKYPDINAAISYTVPATSALEAIQIRKTMILLFFSRHLL